MNELEKLIENKKNYKMKPTKKMVKKGTIAVGVVETTPFVWKEKLYYFEWHRDCCGGDLYEADISGNYRIMDFESGEVVCDFAEGHSFGACYVENERIYVIGVRGGFGGSVLDLYVSDDLISWKQHEVFNDTEWKMYNTSICKGENGYIMTLEIDYPKEIAGDNPYTIVFMYSENLYDWKLMDTDKHIYSKDRYTACPVIKYIGGYYYMIYLEILALYNCLPCIVRSKDLKSWDPAPINPIMFYSDEDKIIPYPDRLTESEKKRVECALNTNNSDIDLCEYDGKTIIMYSWGNQLGEEFLAYAEFDGEMQEFFESFY